ncbi:ParB/RepB/Spo0J family partition protein [Nakamurella aerolata]|uniref:ParB/RepB/Spo0J family partition protein n=1 Tax=Nakamurella aerolata TaxID=1656892 RepID=A0A849AJ85_9ACTN|nr:ParB/RepB/Spo0J family partition protein [Nakamurella aerolata]NNG36872.1 ParB/RepB/Spo0J family partition protein [Nakamurella aerolata]
MSKSRGGLGRGIASLIPTGPTTNTVSHVLLGDGKPVSDPRRDRPVDAQDGDAPERNSPEPAAAERPPADPDAPHYQELSPADIRPNPRNPRSVFDDEALAELEHSLREFGMLQPVVVRRLAQPVPRTAAGQPDTGAARTETPSTGTPGSERETPAEGGEKGAEKRPEEGAAEEQLVHYELVMGERRWRAAQLAGLDTIPAIVRRTEDADLLRDALLENIHRANLNPLEEAAAYQQLLDEFDVTHDELATRIGRSRPVISNTIRLLRLPVPVQRRVAAGVLSAGHARALLSLEDDADAQEQLAARIVAEGLSVRGTEEQVTLLKSAIPKKKPAPRKKMIMPGLDDLARGLSDRFDTRAKVELGRRKGKITLEFASVDDLERIVEILAPELTNRTRPAAADDASS